MIDKVKVIGAGGIGSYLIEPLCRYLNFNHKGCNVTVFDGDSFEESNVTRQIFTKKENKAKHVVERLKSFFTNIYLVHKDCYITEENVILSIRENDIVFLSVDNHATRKLISDRCAELENVVLISGGNDYTDGNVIVYIRRNNEDVTKKLTDIDPGIASPADLNPGEADVESQGCSTQSESEPQLIFMNLAIASSMCNCFYTYEKDNILFHQVFVDILANKMRPSPEIEIDLEETI